ncbi:MAG: hypothetical protein ACREBF_04365 [Candidatus Micrarchaeales archaeon]
MKAQFAFIEAGICMFLAIAAITWISAQTQTTMFNSYFASQNLRGSIAIYDILEQLNLNSSIQKCLILGSKTCINSYLMTYQQVYQLKDVWISVNKAEFGNFSSNKEINCINVHNDMLPYIICLSVSD